MEHDDPVTLWIEELRNADEAAAQKLWRHFVNRLHELGRKKLSPETRRVYDEEDADQIAFHSVCAGIAGGRFPDLREVWRSPRPEIGGSRLPNGWGLFDIIGNVEEWCEDGVVDYGRERLLIDPTGPEHADPTDNFFTRRRAVRGGTYRHTDFHIVTSSNRVAEHPNENLLSIGLRVARNVTQ